MEMEMEMDDVLVQYNGNVKNAYHLPQSYLDVLQINARRNGICIFS